MILDFDKELRIIALVRSLTDAVKRMAHGKWLSDPAVTFLRTELYSRDGLQGWNSSDDREAARRLAIWCDRVRGTV